MAPSPAPGTQHTGSATTIDDAFVLDPYRTYTLLRENGPVHRITLPGGASAWLVIGEPEVRAAFNDPRLSIDRRFSTGGYSGFALPPALDRNLLNMDPPDHTRLRRLVAHAFTHRGVERLSAPIEREANRLLDLMAAHQEADLIGNFAAPLALSVIGDLLGIPSDSRDTFRGWTNTLLAPDPAAPEQARDAVRSIHHYLVGLVDDKRHRAGDDLLSALIAVRDEDDSRLTEDELVSLAFLLFWAGYENTVNLVGNGVVALLNSPDQWDKLRTTPELIGPAVEELLRYAHSNQFAIRRFPLTDVVIGGMHIKKGETVLLGIAAANRDPGRFNAPDDVNLGRTDNSHLSFGQGIHYCVGAPLARLEARIAIATLVRRLPRLSLAVGIEQLRWRRSFRERGLWSLPVYPGPVNAGAGDQA
jgi:cytochrome P450